MTSFEKIRERVEQRLEELLEESTRLAAALEALRGEHAPGSPRVRAGHTTKPVVRGIGRDRLVKTRRGSAVTPAEPDVVDGDGATRDPAVERAVRQLRQELAAGLRNG